MKPYSKGIVFGVFDNFHLGHEHFLREAFSLCEKLTVVVTLPEISKILKNTTPKDSLDKRIKNVKDSNHNLNVIEGDSKLGEWSVLKQEKPDIIILGYDQQGIADELEKINIEYVVLGAHYPEKYKSSLM